MVVIRKLKEKCKDAARKRREKERAEFVELSKLLPLPSSVTNQLDKASIIRLTSSYLRMRTAFPEGLGENWGIKCKRRVTQCDTLVSTSQKFAKTHPLDNGQQLACANNQSSSTTQTGCNQQQQQYYIRELGSLILQTLDGFVFALHRDGKIMYISETASVFLGLPQIDLTGSSLFEHVHPADHGDISYNLNLNAADRDEIARQIHELPAIYNSENEEHCIELNRSFCMRMKCILPKRNAGLVNNGYKAIHCSGYLKVRRRLKTTRMTSVSHSPSCCNQNAAAGRSSSGSLLEQQQHKEEQGHQCQHDRDWDSYALVAVGHSLLPTASTEIKLGTSTFMFRANLDFNLYYIEAPVVKLLGYQQVELVGQSLYQFVHVADLNQVEQAHRQLLDKGQVVSKYYRLMRRDGGFIWLQTFATLVNNPRSMPKPQHVVGICHVIGTDQADQSSAIVLNSQEQIKSLKNKPLDNVCAQLLKPGKQINIGDSLPTYTKHIDDKHNNNKRARKFVVQHHQHHQQQQEITSPRIDSTLTSFQYKQLAIDTQCSQQHASPIYSENNLFEQCNTIGSIRRASDDTCSIVSSIAPASVSSSSGYSSNVSGILSCRYSSSSSSASSSSSSCVSLSESSLSYTTRADTSTQFQYYDQVPKSSETGHYQQQALGTLDDSLSHNEVTWLMPSGHCLNYCSSLEDLREQTKTIRALAGDVSHAPYDQHDSSWQTTSPTTTGFSSSKSSTIATNINLANSPRTICPTIMSPPGRAYFSDQHHHSQAEQSSDYGYYNGDGATSYHNVVPTYLDGKGMRVTPSDVPDESDLNSYQYQYTSPQGTACLSGSVCM